MASMAEKMKEKAIRITSAERSKEIVKTITRADEVQLNRTLEPIIEQNKKEYREGVEKMHDKYVGTK